MRKNNHGSALSDIFFLLFATSALILTVVLVIPIIRGSHENTQQAQAQPINDELVGYSKRDRVTLRVTREEVPGGWIYTTTRTSGTGVATTFVPKPDPGWPVP